ncbi:MAG: RNA polymerase sigma factor [Flavobacteriales bacterium]|nr:RNA polymerase sigma factor [Flavobacteriales bacterium]
MEDHQAIAATRAGDQRAFGHLVRRYKHMVYTVSVRVLRDAHDAEECAQDTFVKAYQNLGGFAGGSKFSTWLYSIAYRTAISRLRSRPEGHVGLDDAPPTLTAAADETALETHDRRTALAIALGQLPGEDAAVVTLYYLAEQSIDEIVTATGLSASNVKVKLHRSRKRLFELLKHQLKEEAWTLL